jgi:hypothetical protein
MHAALAALLVTGLFAALSGCSAEVGPSAPGTLREAVCSPGDSGGDFGCGCTLNSQCTGFDDDTRLIVCDVPSGAMVGKCLDCTAVVARAIGCACSSDKDCVAGTRCNGRTCQKLRQRGEFCVRDTDCGADMTGLLTCLPTKSWCGPLADGYPCDFNADCLSGRCRGGSCSSGDTGSACAVDGDCNSPLVCLTLHGQCGAKQPDGQPCQRNAECQNQCNSFSGQCTLGTSGTICTPKNPDGDCAPGLSCIECGGSYICRPTGGPCV